MDLTRGPILKSVVLFALPLLGSSLVQQLYSTVDLLFVGNVLGTEAAAGLGVSVLLVTCLVGFFTGVSVGVTVLVGKLVGAGDDDAVGRAVHVAVTLALVGGAVFAVVGWLFSPAYIALMATPVGAAAEALLYLRVYFVSFVAVVLYNMCAGVLRAFGDSRAPLVAQFVGGVLNVAMNALFLMVLELGIAGTALATLVSQGVAAALLVRHLAKADGPVRLRLSGLTLRGGMVRPILAVGVPTGLQSTVITLSNVLVQWQINLLGTVPMAAFTSYFKVELPIYLVIVSVGQAATAFVAQNVGAGLASRARKGATLCLGVGVVSTALLSAGLLAVGPWAFGLFGGDDAVVEKGVGIIAITFPFYWLYAVLEVLGAATRGHGRAVGPMVAVMVNICLVRTVLVAGLMHVAPGVGSVAVSYPASWATAAACMAVCYWLAVRPTRGKVAERARGGAAGGLRANPSDGAPGETATGMAS